MTTEIDPAALRQKLSTRFGEDVVTDRFGSCIHLTANLRNYLIIHRVPKEKIHVCAIFDPEKYDETTRTHSAKHVWLRIDDNSGGSTDIDLMEDMHSKVYGMTYRQLKAQEADKVVVDDQKLLFYMEQVDPLKG